MTILSAPAYGVVGGEITVKYKVEDTANIRQTEARITLTTHEGEEQNFVVPVNTEQSISLPIAHPAQNIFKLSVESLADEITPINNSAAILINGVRDRLKVLLVSGKPHAGERTWRDLLTSDTGVDLVHFTILRDPEKVDYTPQDELSLIAFPVRELFETKLKDFDPDYLRPIPAPMIFSPNSISRTSPATSKRAAHSLKSAARSSQGASPSITPALAKSYPPRPMVASLKKPFKPTLTPLGGAASRDPFLSLE